jgi:predicted dehydrogenase
MVTRRSFLKSGLAGAGLMAESRLLRRFPTRAAGDEISVGIMGLGAQGRTLLRNLIALHETRNIRLVSLCDVWSKPLDRAVRQGSNDGYDMSTVDLTDDYRRVLERDDIDAVVIATPDFSHFQIASEAISAGKDIYLEKPMTFTLEEARRLREIVSSSDRVVQVGSHHASDPGYRAAAKIIQSGILGTVSRVGIARNVYQQRWFLDYSDVQPQDVNWELFLTGLPPDQPFDPRLLVQWKLFRQTCHGIAGVFVPHFMTALHTIMGVPHPTSAVADGGVFVWKDGRENPDTFQAVFQYEAGFIVNFGMGFGNSSDSLFKIYGTQGTLDVFNWRVTPEGGAEDTTVTEMTIPEGLSKIEGSAPEGVYLHRDHLANWLDAVESRGIPILPVDVGYGHMVAVQLATDAYWSGVKQTYAGD